MSEARTEAIAGIIVLAALAALAYPALRVGRRDLLGGGGYRVVARFDTVGDLQPGAPVDIAGVPVGLVEGVRLDRHYYADVTLRIRNGVILHDDAIVAIKGTGLTGEEYVSISPGASPQIMKDGGHLRRTKDAVNFEDLIGQYIHGKV